jgi:hypothetical protein
MTAPTTQIVQNQEMGEVFGGTEQETVPEEFEILDIEVEYRRPPVTPPVHNMDSQLRTNRILGKENRPTSYTLNCQ